MISTLLQVAGFVFLIQCFLGLIIVIRAIYCKNYKKDQLELEKIQKTWNETKESFYKIYSCIYKDSDQEEQRIIDWANRVGIEITD